MRRVYIPRGLVRAAGMAGCHTPEHRPPVPQPLSLPHLPVRHTGPVQGICSPVRPGPRGGVSP
jgi:hypothetical protein